jgi:hypothetical protein
MSYDDALTSHVATNFSRKKEIANKFNLNLNMVAIPLKMVFNFYNTFTTSREREIGSPSMNGYNDYLKNLGNFS